jgi:hypothetical protein
MSIFDFRKPLSNDPTQDPLKKLRETLERLNADPEETPGIVDLKRILSVRIAELESRSA